MHIEINGNRLHYERDGAGEPAFVFVHGYTCAHDDWVRQMRALKDRHTVVACDLRGHGTTPGTPDSVNIETYGADVAALVASLGLGRAVLVGHSMGCRVVLEAYRTAPERVAGIVLADGSYQGAGGEAAVRSVREAIAGRDFAEFVGELFGAMFLAPSPDADRVMARAKRMPGALGAALFPRMVEWDVRNGLPTLSRVRCPLLVIQSTYLDSERRRTPLSAGQTSPWLDLIRQHAPHARIEIVAGSGHFPMLDKTAEFNALLSDFAAGLAR